MTGGGAELTEGLYRMSGERNAEHGLNALWLLPEPRALARCQDDQHRGIIGNAGPPGGAVGIEHLVWVQARGRGSVSRPAAGVFAKCGMPQI